MLIKLEDCASVDVGLRNGEVGMKDGEARWAQVVRRRKKSARSEDHDDSGNSNIKFDRRKKFGEV